jgi:membrane fusion protein (multidrug efflux system)
VAELEAEIAQSKLELSRTEVRAPFSGFVTQRTVNIGQRLKPMDNLFSLGAFSPLFADVHLSERDARSVRPGQPATVRLGSDDAATIQGRVERLSPIVDQASGTVKVTVAVEPKTGFRPGSFVRVEIRTDTKADAIVIPKRALIEEDGQNYVFIAQNDTAKRSKVELGYQREGLVEIRNGVKPGESVVVAGQGALKEGGKIKVLSRQTESAAKPSGGV